MKPIEKTTIHKNDPGSAPYVITIAPELISYAKTGQKVKTYRLGRKYDYLNVGDIIEIKNTITKEFTFKAKIINKYFQKFKDLPHDTAGHEVYRDKEHHREVLSGYYAYTGKPIEDNDEFIILEFAKI